MVYPHSSEGLLFPTIRLVVKLSQRLWYKSVIDVCGLKTPGGR